MNLCNQSGERMLTAFFFLSLPLWKIDTERAHISPASPALVPQDSRGAVRVLLCRLGFNPLLRWPRTASLYRRVRAKLCSNFFRESQQQLFFYFSCLWRKLCHFVCECCGYWGWDDSGDRRVFWYCCYLLRSEQDDIAVFSRPIQTWLITAETIPMGSIVMRSLYVSAGLHSHGMQPFWGRLSLPPVCLSPSVSLLPGSSECLTPVKSLLLVDWFTSRFIRC